MNADDRDPHDFGVQKLGTWDDKGMPTGWYINASHIADDLPRWLLTKPVLHLSDGPSCCVYLRGCYSDQLTRARKAALIKAGGATALINATGGTVGVPSSITFPTALADLRHQRHQIPGMEREVWIVGTYRGRTADGHTAWDLQGVFTSKEAALAACRDRSDFIGPATLNKELPQDAQTWPGCEYPLS